MLNKPKYLRIICFLIIILLSTGLIFVWKFSTISRQEVVVTATDQGSVKGNFIEKISDERLDTMVEADPIDISEISFDQLVEDKYYRLFYIENDRKRKITLDGHPIERFLFSPTKTKFGYMENFDIYNESIPWDREVVLHIGEIATGKTKEVYSGSFKTSGWEWFSEDEVLIPYDCGTECQVLYLVNVKTDQRQTIQQGVGYQWSSDKNWLSAYRYSGKLGVVVFNRNQDKIYEYLNESDQKLKYNEEIKTFWAPSSNRLTMIKEKANEDQLELVIADFDHEGKILVQKDLVDSECANLSWYNDDEIACFQNGSKEIIRLSN